MVGKANKQTLRLSLVAECNKKKGGMMEFARKALLSGTTNDRLASLVLLVQESPVHAMSHLDSLISMARRKGDRTGCINVISN